MISNEINSFSSSSRESVSFLDFLREIHDATKDIFAGNMDYTDVHVCVGNEAGDADTICSAICLSFLKKLENEGTGKDFSQLGRHDIDNSIHQRLHVPVLPFPRRDLALRKEVLVLFDLCHIDASALIFVDEIKLHQLQEAGRLRLTLTDHNAVSGPLASLGRSVVEIVDHHQDLGKHGHVKGSLRDVAFDENTGSEGSPLVGSCCTLIAERFLDQQPDMLRDHVAKMLLGVILIDTHNLDVASKRAKERDINIAEELSRRIDWHSNGEEIPTDNPNTSPVGLFRTLQGAKFDSEFWSSLTAEDCLRYDYKQFTAQGGNEAKNAEGQTQGRELSFGMSSILCRLETFMSKPGIDAAVRDYVRGRSIDSLIVMTSTLGEGDSGNGMRREIMIFVVDANRRAQLRAHLEGPKAGFLDLRAKSSHAEEFIQWEMGNTRASRKQVAPTILSFYQSIS